MQGHKHDVVQDLRALSGDPIQVDAAFKHRLVGTLQQHIQQESRSPLPVLEKSGIRLPHFRWAMAGLVVLFLAVVLMLNTLSTHVVLTVHQGVAEVRSSQGWSLPWNPSKSGQIESNSGVSIVEGTSIILPEGGAGELSLFRGSRVELAPGTQLTLTEAQPGSILQDSVVRMDVSSGEVRAEVTPLRSPSARFEVATPSVLVSVKGTVFSTRVITPLHSYIATEVGVVVVTLDDPEQNFPSVEVPAGYAVDAIVGMPLVVRAQHPNSQTQTAQSLFPSTPSDNPLTPDEENKIPPSSNLPETGRSSPSSGAASTVQATLGASSTLSPTPSQGSILTQTTSITPSNSKAVTDTPTPTLTPNSTTGADLEIKHWTNPNPTAAESRLTYVLQITNHGPSIAKKVVVTETLPSEVRLITATLPLKQHTSPLVWIIDTLQVGETQKLVVEVNVRAWVTRAFTSIVTATATSPDLYPANNSHTISSRVTTSADVAIANVLMPSQVGAGGTVTGTIRYTNFGPAAAGDVTITLRLPDALHFQGSINDDPLVTFIPPPYEPGTLTFDPAMPPKWTIRKLQAGRWGTLVFTATVRPDSLDQVTSTVYVATKSPDNNTRNNTFMRTQVMLPMADLRIAQQSTPEAVVVGDVLTYTLTYTNAGPWPAQSLRISTTLSPDVTFGGQVSATPELSKPKLSGRTLTWYTSTLPTGVTGQVVFTVTTRRQAQTPLYHRARIESATLDEPSNNVSAGYTPILIPALQVQMWATPTRVAPQMPLTCTLKLTNTGQVPFRTGTLQITTTLPPGAMIVTGSEALQSSSSGNVAVGYNQVPLLPGETLSTVLVVSLTQPPAAEASIITTSATAAVPGGHIASADSRAVQVVLPEVAVDQHVTQGINASSQENVVTATVYLTNTGPSPLLALSVREQYDPAALTLITADPEPTLVTDEGTMTWSNLVTTESLGGDPVLASRDGISITLVFTTPYSPESPTPIEHTVTVNNVKDVYQNRAQGTTQDLPLTGTYSVYLTLVLRK